MMFIYIYIGSRANIPLIVPFLEIDIYIYIIIKVCKIVYKIFSLYKHFRLLDD